MLIVDVSRAGLVLVIFLSVLQSCCVVVAEDEIGRSVGMVRGMKRALDGEQCWRRV